MCILCALQAYLDLRTYMCNMLWAWASISCMHICYKECEIRKCKVLSSSRERQTVGTQMAVKNVWWFMGEVIHAFSHHVRRVQESKVQDLVRKLR